MNVTCPGCSTVFRVDPAKVPAGGVRARCSVCRAVFRVEADAVEVPAAAPAPAPATIAPPAPARSAPPAPSAPVAPPRVSDHAVASPPFVVPPPAPARPAATTFPPPAPAPSAGAPHVRPPFSSRPVSIATPTAPRAASPRPSANPFLSKDPGQKARRLARALVSDIVVYHPEKRLEGLRHGTLKQIFEEEIKKSWEEYAGQVGRELAESTTHFNDALNEILGDGSKIF
jgi:predicted Zn finger-like uncharacterized protein